MPHDIAGRENRKKDQTRFGYSDLSLLDYEDRLRRVTQFIHDHLDEELDLNRLAEVACLSPYHWHRVYHAVNGETAAATVRRLRLQRAAGELAYSARPVADIAARAGYSTAAAFTRAFAEAYGQPPAQYRTQGTHTRYAALPRKQGETFMFDVTIREFPARTAVTLAHQGSYQKIGRAFEQVGTWFAVRGLFGPESRMIGLYYDDPAAVPEEKLRSAAGIVVSSAPAGVESPYEVTQIRGGEYAVLRHQGPYTDLPAAYRWLYGEWLPKCGREVADAPPLEEYLNTPRDVPPTELLTDICVPLK